ncbi:chemotaxis protein CheW [Methylobacillus flagellatus]|uniref:Chemotaxis protein CheA n=1 Tax=Methylobacillus flagellatus (strain ATCC 51484 / DSM 6875 / VKM B-1610 / KT) TaxID=265072 RepID=Q1GZY4_METFK|nr:chemotaxis protein CheW [Methylobacillus flagellatus]ABE50203.1 CheA signal transduction histidine kinases [Methylobacillus flagellatus KT]
MTIDMSQFYQVFFDESDELLAEAERLLLELDIESPSAEDLNAIFRAVHSIKGGAATFGMADMTEITHVLENLLDRIRKNEMKLQAEHVDVFLAAKDILKMQLDGHRNGSLVDQEAVSEVKATLHVLAQEDGKSVPALRETLAQAEKTPEATNAKPDAQAIRRYQVQLPVLPDKDVKALSEELALLGTVEALPPVGDRHVIQLETDETLENIIAICSFVLDPDDLVITEQSGGAQDMSSAKPSSKGGQGFLIEIPDITDKDWSTLVSELELLGKVVVQPMAGKLRSLWLETEEKRDSILAVSSFVVDVDKLKVAEANIPPGTESVQPSSTQAAEKPLDEGDFGLFDASVAKPEAGNQPAPIEGAKTTGEPLENKRVAPRREADKVAVSQETTSIRVGIEKVDQLINLVGELVITQAMIEQRTSTLDPMVHERLLNSVGQLTRNTRDLQEAVMSIRMMPMDYVFSRFPRMVRDLASKLGKKVEFVTNGAATELDKGLIERIVDPLTHLVRNSIDHGIEPPEVRTAAGKSPVGRLSLSAGHQGGNIIIEVSDDGGGLNRERILNKAKSSGLSVSDTMPDSDVWQLIFAPGFSTAEQVTDVSGRGVGMDVVKRNITAMGGVVDIRSAAGYGTTISISLPLTLAILDGMSIRVGEEVYILPLSFVMESLQPSADDVKEVTGQGRLVKVREDYLPLIPLYQMFGIEPLYRAPEDGILVVLQADGKKAALFVDELVGQQQVVVKNLESNYRKVAGISGATILGDGGVALILDVANLLRSSRQLITETSIH